LCEAAAQFVAFGERGDQLIFEVADLGLQPFDVGGGVRAVS
jgi:hypothetical protein